MITTLIDVETVHDHLGDRSWVVVDCRFDLADPAAGEAAYQAGHIPGALYAHLDRDLSGPPLTDAGRHPLPSPAAMTRFFGRLGIAAGVQVVVYDGGSGAIASRLWWMLRFMGHDAVAVLDGGWPAWLAAGFPVRDGVETRPQALFTGEPRREWLVVIDEVSEARLLIDAREGARYRGEVEPLDARAGHIPGAVNYPYALNLGEDGRFLPAERIREQLAQVLGKVPVKDAVFYCGSGVSACLNLLAAAHAGLGSGRLYVGSWSEWSRDPARPAIP